MNKEESDRLISSYETGRLISPYLWGAMKIAELVRERVSAEGPTTLALELVSSHPILLRGIDDAELIRLTALLQALERGKMFLRHQDSLSETVNPLQPIERPQTAAREPTREP